MQGMAVSNPECSEKCAMVVHALSVRSDIKYRYARTVVYSKMGNPANSSNQATFSVTLPDTAFITGFFLEMDGKKYEAYIKKKEQAEKEYQDALEAGNTAAHVGTSTRDSNVFVVSVNVAARSKVTFNLTYEELLRRRLSAYHHTVTLTPGQIVQDMSVDVFIREIRNITFLNVTTSDESRLLESGDNAGEMSLGSSTESYPAFARIGLRENPEKPQPGGDAVVVEYLSPMSAHVHFNPSEGEQQGRLEVGYQQLVVQYDVDRATNPSGDIMLMDGYFVHFFAPENVAPHPKHIIFVLDTSGSMWGRKLQQLQQAMYSILDSLREEDYFSIVQFSTNVTIAHALGNLLLSQEWSVRPQEMVGLSKYSVTHEVNEVNIAKAKQFIKSMEASGGTNISGALRKALQLAAKEKYGTGSVDESGEKRDFGSEDKPQPMLIFLTDGIATVGELLSSKILAQVRAVNTEIKAAIFSLAFGDGANYRFLKKLSLQNYAFSRKIYEASDAALQLQSFYNEIASPLLANVTFNYLDGKIDKDSLTTNQFHSYYGGSEIVVAGKLSGAEDDEDLGAEVNAWSGGEHKEVLYKPLCTSEKNQVENVTKHRNDEDYIHHPLLQIERRKHHSGGRSLERLWAYLTVRQLLDQHLASTDKDDDVTTFEDKQEQFASRLSPRARALELALKVEKFKYLGATVTNINDTREEIKRRINMGNACYYLVEKLLSSSLRSKNLEVRICTVILLVFLYGCETWTLTLREEQRLRVFENKVLKKIFGAKRDEVTGEWRKLHKTELHALFSSLDIIRNIKSRRLRWAGHVARMGESRNAYRVLIGRPEGKRPLGRPRRRWEDIIKMDLREMGYDCRDWINLAWDRDQWRPNYGFVTPITSLIVVIPVNGSDDEVSELVKDPVGSNALDPSPVLESAPIQNKIIPLAPFLFRPSPVAMKPSALHTTVLHSTTTASTTTDYSMMDLNDVPHVTNYTLGDVTWLLDYFDSEDRLIVANNTDNSTYVVVKVPSSPEVRLSIMKHDVSGKPMSGIQFSTYIVFYSYHKYPQVEAAPMERGRRKWAGALQQVTENTEECATPGGEPGNCRIFASCVQSDFLDDYQVFLKFFCPIGRFAGVCCPYSLLNDTSVTTTVIPTVE
ncbi:hypothetical protein ANN_07435 [Periplaneta americana]|uniref:Uncharacterized protein n=1 Tax=Periplaneta americana TaxID=6978 RepID=A0ABQ8SZA0_PERAM|nr:hypothetical protein ANN_07435 [Periplaneta americana]